MKGKIVGLYCSANYCHPCKEFTPLLIEFYKKFSKSKNFEIIFISLDQTEDEFNKYYSEMPWYAVSFTDHKVKVKEWVKDYNTISHYCNTKNNHLHTSVVITQN